MIRHDSDDWRILSVGAHRDGKLYCHLASLTRSVAQRNGARSIQSADWIDAGIVEHATDRPRGFYAWNPALRGAFNKGIDAHQSGKPLADNPYPDTRKYCGRLTWSRAFIAAWRDGWNWSKDAAMRKGAVQ